MKTFNRFAPRLTRPWMGILALVLGSSAAAATPSPRSAGAPPATEQLIAQAQAQAEHANAQSGKPVPCPHKHQHGLRYRVQRLDVTRFEAFPTAINNRGWVVGYSDTATGVMPTLWIGSRAFDLGSLGGTVGYAYDINDAGQVVGFSNNANGVMRAFSWYRGQITPLQNLGGSTTSFSVARGINRSGVIGGTSAIPDGSRARAVLWRKGTPRPLESLGGSNASVLRVNDAGFSVGVSNDISATQHAALWTPKGEVVDLGAEAVATDINNSRHIVGYTFTGTTMSRPAKWYGGVRTILPTLGGENGAVFGINEKDEAVGFSQTAKGLERATVWFGAKPVQLDTLLDDASRGITIDAAYAINDKGQIAAIQRLPNNRVQPLVLTPHRCHGK
ncbi:MAG: hypothetical protein AB1584_24490 [Pseudomonadota bacterium]